MSKKNKLGPNEVRCPKCRVVTQGDANSIVNKQKFQVFYCPCGAKVPVPGERDND